MRTSHHGTADRSSVSRRARRAALGPISGQPPSAQVSTNGAGIRFTIGSAAVHWSIQELFRAVGDPLSEYDFQQLIDHPEYDPARRMVLWDGDRLVGHVHWRPRPGVGPSGQPIEIADVTELAVLPEYRQMSWDVPLLDRLLESVAASGVQWLSTRVKPDWCASLVERGWHRCAKRRIQASPLDIVSSIQEHYQFAVQEWTVRPWRYFELPTLMRLHTEHVRRLPGSWLRPREEWEWLVSRRAFDQIFAIVPRRALRNDGADRSEEVAGYAVVRRHSILELVVATSLSEAAVAPILRVAQDAVELGDDTVVADVSPSDRRMVSLWQGLITKDSAERATRSPGPVTLVRSLEGGPRAAQASVPRVVSCGATSASSGTDFDITQWWRPYWDDVLIAPSGTRFE